MNIAIRLCMIYLSFTAIYPCISLAVASQVPREPIYVAFYLGPSQLTSAHCPRGGKPIQIAQVEANQGWKDWAFKRATDGPLQKRDPWDPWEYDQDLLTMFIPTLQQIAEATTLKLRQPYEIYYIVLSSELGQLGKATMYALIRNSTDPDSEHFADPPLPSIDLDGHVPFIRVGPAALMAYNLTTPEAWGARRRTLTHNTLRPSDNFQYDNDFALIVNFEPKYLELAFECPKWDCERRIRALFPDLGEENLFHGATLFSVTPEEWQPIYKRLFGTILAFMKSNSPSPEYGTLRIVTLFGGVSPKFYGAIQLVLENVFRELEKWRLKILIDPAFVPSLGAALLARNEVESHRPAVDLYGTAHLAEQALLGSWPVCAPKGFCNIFHYYRLKEHQIHKLWH
ncbi:hypothetical protein F5884DRAFT_786617 [Xylogone sp. PMI_703]|nr:hypothetical protein F5884DRAFT_786617 [Xylogone sp. PMI_703]